MSVVRPEFGPTLPELLAPRVRALPRAAQIALAVLAALVVAGAVYVVVHRREADERPQAVVRSPIADGVLQPKWYVEGETEVLGANMEETRAFAMKALERRLKVIGLAPVAQ